MGRVLSSGHFDGFEISGPPIYVPILSQADFGAQSEPPTAPLGWASENRKIGCGTDLGQPFLCDAPSLPYAAKC